MGYIRGKNSPVSIYPFEPIFAEPCKESDKGAFKNLGGWWVRERNDPRHSKQKRSNNLTFIGASSNANNLQMVDQRSV